MWIKTTNGAYVGTEYKTFKIWQKDVVAINDILIDDRWVLAGKLKTDEEAQQVLDELMHIIEHQQLTDTRKGEALGGK